jgi:hypothetical protein
MYLVILTIHPLMQRNTLLPCHHDYFCPLSVALASQDSTYAYFKIAGFIYAKNCTYLRCFGSRFMLKSIRARTRALLYARDFHVVIWFSFVVTKQNDNYAKIHTHLYCFGSHFTLKSTRARIRA